MSYLKKIAVLAMLPVLWAHAWAAPSGRDSSSIWESAYLGDLPGIKAGLAWGTGVNARDVKGNTPLLAAFAGGDKHSAVRFLLSKGADLRAANQVGENALVFAVRGGNLNSVGFLLRRGFDVNARDKNDCTALMHAAVESGPGMIRFLLKKGASLGALTNGKGFVGAGYGALFFAADADHVDNIKVLLAAGADVNAKDGQGMTPLTLAGLDGYQNEFPVLLSAGASPGYRDRSGGTYLDEWDIFECRRDESALGTAIAVYYGDYAKYPRNLRNDLVPKYMYAIPARPLREFGSPSNPVEYFPFLDSRGRVDPGKLRNTGRWLYDRTSGILIMDSTHKDGLGRFVFEEPGYKVDGSKWVEAAVGN